MLKDYIYMDREMDMPLVTSPVRPFNVISICIHLF